MNESETLNRSFTIILAVHQPYSIMLHVTYVYTMQDDLQTGPETLPHFLPDLWLGVSVPYIYIEREREREFTGIHWLKSIRASLPCKSRHLWKRSIYIIRRVSCAGRFFRSDWSVLSTCFQQPNWQDVIFISAKIAK